MKKLSPAEKLYNVFFKSEEEYFNDLYFVTAWDQEKIPSGKLIADMFYKLQRLNNQEIGEETKITNEKRAELFSSICCLLTKDVIDTFSFEDCLFSLESILSLAKSTEGIKGHRSNHSTELNGIIYRLLQTSKNLKPQTEEDKLALAIHYSKAMDFVRQLLEMGKYSKPNAADNYTLTIRFLDVYKGYKDNLKGQIKLLSLASDPLGATVRIRQAINRIPFNVMEKFGKGLDGILNNPEMASLNDRSTATRDKVISRTICSLSVLRRIDSSFQAISFIYSLFNELLSINPAVESLSNGLLGFISLLEAARHETKLGKLPTLLKALRLIDTVDASRAIQLLSEAVERAKLTPNDLIYDAYNQVNFLSVEDSIQNLSLLTRFIQHRNKGDSTQLNLKNRKGTLDNFKFLIGKVIEKDGSGCPNLLKVVCQSVRLVDLTDVLMRTLTMNWFKSALAQQSKMLLKAQDAANTLTLIGQLIERNKLTNESMKFINPLLTQFLYWNVNSKEILSVLEVVVSLTEAGYDKFGENIVGYLLERLSKRKDVKPVEIAHSLSSLLTLARHGNVTI